jgi:CheY-like chemotaxis protein
LLVEDEDAVRTLAFQVLQRHGYTVLEARNGREALQLCARYGEPIRLLITDAIMPQMSGRQLADRLLRDRPHLKILFISGYTNDAVLSHGGPAEAAVFLQKPFTPQTLVRRVRELLGA